MEHDDLYNLDNWMRAVAYVTENCQIKSFDEVYPDYDTIIYEGGQGLLLDQSNVGDFPHLTPSSVGAYNIAKDISALNLPTSVYYVSRTYMTRHGAGPMEAECEKKDINPNIVDKTNEENPWQGKLRFGYLNTDSLYDRVRRDLSQYGNKVEANMVFTQLNYTNNKLCVGSNQFIEIAKPDFIHSILGSDREDNMFKVE
jgi:adenylosuccinate synthase